MAPKIPEATTLKTPKNINASKAGKSNRPPWVANLQQARRTAIKALLKTDKYNDAPDAKQIEMEVAASLLSDKNYKIKYPRPSDIKEDPKPRKVRAPIVPVSGSANSPALGFALKKHINSYSKAQRRTFLENRDEVISQTLRLMKNSDATYAMASTEMKALLEIITAFKAKVEFTVLKRIDDPSLALPALYQTKDLVLHAVSLHGPTSEDEQDDEEESQRDVGEEDESTDDEDDESSDDEDKVRQSIEKHNETETEIDDDAVPSSGDVSMNESSSTESTAEGVIWSGNVDHHMDEFQAEFGESSLSEDEESGFEGEPDVEDVAIEDNSVV